ncbi:maleylpyruvate isomerase family mycothiol-dependent enzyme [Ornithinimicrobium cryptoxanthini]|uniref:maleylpyruvate isomerase family mycothiol-dependent enzyme n=1 Tax=Ornithinimicrobium cryptoxanthini TaxID=2934161 RepID=UPI002118511C|nr:maleylpyruvate isomerase family mycothiol-dependent enzyme [Ornithinimicrobium cryptoxanthini]
MTEGKLSAGRAIDLLADADRALAVTMARMTEAQLHESSRCDGWTRAHVLAHVARNADGLQHLVQWATSGREHPAYSSPEQRDQDIEEGARQPLPRLRADVVAASNAFRSRVETLRGRTDLSEVRIASGRPTPGDRVPWMRLREVTYHHVDLDLGFTFAHVPPEVVRAGITEAVERVRAGAPPLTLIGTDNRRWHIHGGGNEVHGHPADLLFWLARGVEHGLTSHHPLPKLPSWG